MKVYRLIIAVFIVFSIVFTTCCSYGKLRETNNLKPMEYKGVLTIWHVDGFEGGKGSRKQFLLKSARAFEKQNPGVLIMVIEHTHSSVKESLDKGLLPDMVSFSAGSKVSGVSELNVMRTVSGGLVGSKPYATAWCKGNYFLIANPSLVSDFSQEIPFLLVSQAAFTQPLTAMLYEEICVKDFEVKAPMDAYVKFVSGKTPYMLGSQRDIIRFENRGFEVLTKPLTMFNDLYQYVCVTAKDAQRAYYSQSFINHLLSDQTQKTLNQIGMFSPYIKVEFDNAHLSNVELNFKQKTVSAFTDALILREMQDLSIDGLKGNEKSIKKIKNLVV